MISVAGSAWWRTRPSGGLPRDLAGPAQRRRRSAAAPARRAGTRPASPLRTEDHGSWRTAAAPRGLATHGQRCSRGGACCAGSTQAAVGRMPQGCARRHRLGAHRALRRHAPRLPGGVLGRRERGRRRCRRRAVRAAHVRDHRASTTATSPTARSRPRGRRSSPSRCSAPRPCSADRSGGPPITVTTMPLGPARRRPLAEPARLPVVAHGMVPLAPPLRTRLGRVRDLLRYPELRWLTASTSSCRSCWSSDCCCSQVAGRGAPGTRHQRRARCWCGVLRFHGGLLPRHLHHQLAVPRLGTAPLCHRRREAATISGWP